jgi:hypothetical protein
MIRKLKLKKFWKNIKRIFSKIIKIIERRKIT